VMRTGYQDDLSLYYLGRAAEGSGFKKAAASYYRQSIELSGTSISCVYLSGLCGGVSLPIAASQRLAAVERPSSPRRSRAKQPAEKPSAPKAGAVPTPEPTATAQPTLPPEPVAVPSGTPEYVEPPGARR
jgi:hypothetical protein